MTRKNARPNPPVTTEPDRNLQANGDSALQEDARELLSFRNAELPDESIEEIIEDLAQMTVSVPEFADVFFAALGNTHLPEPERAREVIRKLCLNTCQPNTEFPPLPKQETAPPQPPIDLGLVAQSLPLDEARVRTLRGVDGPPSADSYRRFFRTMFVAAGRERIENPPKPEELSEFLGLLLYEIRQADPTVDTRQFLKFLKSILPSTARYSLRQLAEATKGLEAKISRLNAEALRLDRTEPRRAGMIRGMVAYLAQPLPRTFVPTPQRNGRPKLNSWKEILFDRLFRAGMPIKRMARLLKEDPAFLRRHRNMTRLPKSTTEAALQLLAEPPSWKR